MSTAGEDRRINLANCARMYSVREAKLKAKISLRMFERSISLFQEASVMNSSFFHTVSASNPKLARSTKSDSQVNTISWYKLTAPALAFFIAVHDDYLFEDDDTDFGYGY